MLDVYALLLQTDLDSRKSRRQCIHILQGICIPIGSLLLLHDSVHVAHTGLAAQQQREAHSLVPEDALNPGLASSPLHKGGHELLVCRHASTITIRNLGHPDRLAVSGVQHAQLILNGCQVA